MIPKEIQEKLNRVYDEADLMYFIIESQGAIEGFVVDRLSEEVCKLDVTDAFWAGYIASFIQSLNHVYHRDVVENGMWKYTIDIYTGSVEFWNRIWDITVLVVDWYDGTHYIYMYLKL